MNNKFSDIDKVIITAWLFFGAGVGAFVAPLFKASLMLAGGIGLFAGATVAYILFFEPWRLRYGLLFPYPTEEDDLAENEDDETESDISEFIKDSFESEGLISEDDIVFNNGKVDESDTKEAEDNSEIIAEDEAEENDIDSSEPEEDIKFSEDESDEELETDEIEDEEYENEDLPEEEDSELGESEEDESLEEDDELEEQDALPAFYGNRNQIHSSYDEYESEEPQGFKAWTTPTRLPIILAIAWFFISGYISSNHSEIIKTVPHYSPVWFFTVLPILFLIGLSGLIGVLFRERDESLEISPKENAAYLINLLKIFTGWGIGVYAILVNL